jgi:lipopolysaccharide/colanic/teichoic acid biosynthesis glycosyltransferase
MSTMKQRPLDPIMTIPDSKRILDILISSAALIFLSPLLFVIMVILKFTGEGEIFFLQPRVGQNGKLFHLFKFATMLKASPNMAGGVLTTKNDPRILPAGKFLRKTKINELPQLINILKGEMSVVGPRPQAQAHFDVFPAHVKREIVKVKPGLTGVGSVVFRDEEELMARSPKGAKRCYEEDIAPYKGELEIWYVRNQTIRLDLVLSILTLLVIVFPGIERHTQVFKAVPQKPPQILELYGL